MRNIVSPLDGIRSPFGRRLGAAPFTPASLFAASEPGGWYDPSDLTTLYQDAAGTTPLTAVEQPVGLVLDKSKGLTLGSELVTNGDFSNGTTGWESGSSNTTLTVVGGEAKSEVTTASSRALLYRPVAFATSNVLYKVEFDVYSPGYSGAIRCSLNASVADDGFSFTATVTATKTRVTSYLRAGPTPELYITSTPSALSLGSIVYFDNVSVKQVQGSHLSQSTAAARPVLSARVNALVNTATLSTQNVTTLATNYTLRFEGTGSIALSGTGSGTYSAGAHTVTCTAGTLTLTVTGSVTNADLRPANAGVGLPSYQRVGAATDYDTTGFPLYLKFDGTDDFLQSSTINPGSVDKAQVFAGVRKLSDAADRGLLDYGPSWATQTGSFGLYAPSYRVGGLPAPKYTTALKGSTGVRDEEYATYTAPITNVLAIAYNIGAAAASEISTRINGGVVSPSSAGGDAGGGNFSSLALQVGRYGTNPSFNGQLYSLILRFSAANLDAATITATETWVNGKTLAY